MFRELLCALSLLVAPAVFAQTSSDGRIPEDNFTKDFNPGGLDIRIFGARAVASNSNLLNGSITATINSGSAVATINTSNPAFMKGDYVAIPGAGTSCSLSTPSAPTSVTPSIAAGPTNTERYVAGPTGSTTSSYKIIARSTNGCLTAASGATTITNGQASLGPQSATISTASTFIDSNGNTEATFRTSAATGIAVGAWVQVIATSYDPIFAAWYKVISTGGGGRTFNVLLNKNQTNLAITSATGGTVYYWNENVVKWTAVSGAWEYYIYKQIGGFGNYNLSGVSKPSGSVVADTQYEDYGSASRGDGNGHMGDYTGPSYVPTTAPSASFPAMLLAQVTAGGGTTSLTLSVAASNSVTSAPVRLDDGQAMVAAGKAIVAKGGGTLYVPIAPSANYCYPINSYTVLPAVGLWESGNICATETFQVPPGTKWYGAVNPQNTGTCSTQFGYQGETCFTSSASPAIYGGGTVGVSFGLDLRNMAFIGGNTNQSILALFDEGAFYSMEDVLFGFNPIWNSIGLEFRANTTADQTFPVTLKKITANIGPSQTFGQVTTPAVFFKNFGNVNKIEYLSLSFEGVALDSDVQANLTLDHPYAQGPNMPMVTQISNGGGIIELKNWCLDSAAVPAVSVIGSGGPVKLVNQICNIGSTSGGIESAVSGNTQVIYDGSITGYSFLDNGSQQTIAGFSIDGNGGFHTNFPGSLYQREVNSQIAVGNRYSIHTIDTAPTTAASCSVATAGPPFSIAVTATYQYAFAYPDGGIGIESPVSSSCTTNGTSQQVTITVPALSTNPGASGYYIFANFRGASWPLCNGICTMTTPTTFVWTGSQAGNPGVSNIAGSGPAGMVNGKIWANNGLFGTISTLSNCSSTASPAVCGSASSGALAIAAGTISITVSTSAVTPRSEIMLQEDASLGSRLGVTCNTRLINAVITARKAGTSFTITLGATPVTDPACYSFTIVN